MKLKDIILKQKGNVKTYFQGDMNQIEKQQQTMYTRTFKLKLHSLNAFKLEDVNNMAMYLDKY